MGLLYVSNNQAFKALIGSLNCLKNKNNEDDGHGD